MQTMLDRDDPRPVSRRTLFRAVGAAAAVTAVGAGALPAAAASRPRVSQPTITLVVTPWGQDGALATTTELLYKAMAPFRASHPGVKLSVLPALAGADFVPNIIAGDAPDVIHDWTIAPYQGQDYLLPLDAYIMRDNVDLNAFTAPMVAKLHNLKGATIGLPAILSTAAVATDLGALDAKGLSYPEQDWDYTAFTQLAEKLAVFGKTPRLGATLFPEFATGPGRPAGFYFRGFGAAYVDPANSARCGLDTPGGAACAAWMGKLLANKIAQIATVEYMLGPNASMGMVPSWSLVAQAENFRSLKWDYWNMPLWPTGPATFSTSNFWAIPKTAKHPELSWELLRWLATSQSWAYSNIKLFMMSPALKAMWEPWERMVRQIAPPLATKNLGAFSQLALTNAAYPAETYTYADPVAYNLIINGPFGLLSAVVPRKVSAHLAVQQISKQVDALEASGAAEAAQQARLLRTLAGTATAAQFAPPARTGLGSPPHNGRRAITVAKGSYTLLGAGGDVWNGDDSCAFAAAPWTGEGGEFVCRVTAVAAVRGALNQWAKAGLMARGNLSNDAALVAVEVTGQNGIWSQNEFQAAGNPSSWGSGVRGSTTTGGFITGSDVTLNASKPEANYLIKPVWLKLSRTGLFWTAFSSLDGKTWAQAGAPIPALMGSCWVGVFTSSAVQSNEVRATFDSLSFVPHTFALLGAA